MTVKITLDNSPLILNGRDHELVSGTLTSDGQGFSGVINIASNLGVEIAIGRFGIDATPISSKSDGSFTAGFTSDYVGYSKPPHHGPLPTIEGNVTFQYAEDHSVYAECDVSIGALDE